MIGDLLSSWISATIGAIGALAWVCYRFKLLRLVSVDEGTEWIRAKWGVAQRYRTSWFGHEKGRLVRLKAGRHLMIRGIYDGWEISLKEILLKLDDLTSPFHGRMLSFGSSTIGYQAIATDDRHGDKMMLRNFLGVRNIDRDNQKSEELDQKVIGVVVNELRLYLSTAATDDYGLPVIRDGQLKKRINRSLKQNGVELTCWLYAAPVWVVGQLQFDAGCKIADAIRDSKLVLPDADIIDLPQSHTA